MGKHLVLGNGGIGRSTAQVLRDAGHDVTVGSRSGRPTGLDDVRSLAVECTDPAALAAAADGVDSIVNALNPKQYTHWDRDWPPMAQAVLAAAQRSGAGLVTIGNLYGYGRVDAPMVEVDDPKALRPRGIKGRVRADMWAAAKAAHDAGRVRATELRASDYFGAGAGAGVSYLNTYVLKPAAAGRAVRLMMGAADAPHSWTYLPDIGRLAATLATDDRSWGHVWHVPTAPARSVREVVADVAQITGRGVSKVSLLPAAVRGAMRIAPIVRSLDETKHQFERPFLLDARHTEQTFGLAPTPWTAALRETIEALFGQNGAAAIQSKSSL
ncbi:NAD-dependent epimerase/dehydratase family protein [Calidifontibacter indicus]|uniref:Nucleoside-diphosphate-sugar epimerase n=1 Tax=Calidifontibacter indicus TaxID=419650 RepID=A0A3D9URV1_9MICO|nr:NAD-dependent epimerase/dehydratase family protein [Calidifontibacter indicus]REF32047.1 nucleoside-diphosphate-sugar epimerase [Calidifontibacter indicus]